MRVGVCPLHGELMVGNSQRIENLLTRLDEVRVSITNPYGIPITLYGSLIPAIL